MKKIISKSLKKANLKTVNLSIKKINDIKLKKISERNNNLNSLNNIITIKNICRVDRKIKSVNCFNKKKDKLKTGNNYILTEFKICKSDSNKKEENLYLYKTKENIDISDNKKYDKINIKDLILNHNINIKKIYNDIKLAIKRQKEKEKEKEKIKSNDVHFIFQNHNYTQEFSNSNNEYALNSEGTTNKSLINKDDEICEIGSITKKLDFTKYNNEHCGDIFYIYNNKEYNDFKSNFDKGFNKKISLMKMINDFNSNSFINNLSKKIK